MATSGVKRRLRELFLVGLAVVLPLIVTYILLRFLFETLDQLLDPIIQGTLGRRGPGLGLLATLAIILLVGVLTTNIVGRKKLLYSLDPPQRYETRDDCNDGPPFVNRVDSVFADVLGLDDDTFLMIDHQHGTIVRFDTGFRSKSSLLNQRLFVVEENVFNDWLRQMNYGSRANLNLNLNLDLQIQQDGVYQSLMKLKARSRP